MNKTRPLHQDIVEVTLPRFAENLKREGIVLDYTRRSFKVKGEKLLQEHTFNIKPDLLLVLPDGKRFLVEVVNPKDPKRFMGEIACVQLLGFQKLIDAAIIFILPLGPEHSRAPEKGVRLSLAASITGLPQIIRTIIPAIVVSWSTREDFSYTNLRSYILSRRSSWWGKE